MLHRMQNRGDSVVVHLETSGRMLPDAPSRNAVAEIRGSTHPDEIIVMGGHIDSWDVGQGAMDDAGGVVAAWEALRLIKALGLKPKRTIRVVGWTNEEFGTRGGQAYKATHESEVGKHVVAIESDNGVFRPYGFRFQGSPAGLAVMKALGARVLPAGMNRIVAGEGEADVDALITAGVPGLALDVDPSRYFYYHHTEADMMTALDRDDFNRCVAVLAAMAYALAETDVTPEHTTPKTSTRRR
jgi:carboxypeptidase Q